MSSGNNNDHDSDRGQVLPFRPRTSAPRIEAFRNLSSGESPVQDIGRYDRGNDDPDDYTHRMKMNALAVLALAVLIGGGMWIVDTMAQMRKNQDCVLSGRRNCGQAVAAPGSDLAPGPVVIPSSKR
jgi:hypothetical protein